MRDAGKVLNTQLPSSSQVGTFLLMQIWVALLDRLQLPREKGPGVQVPTSPHTRGVLL